MTDKTKLSFSNYACPKCRGTKADVRDVVLAKYRWCGFIPMRDTRYVEVTCVLCGYTEFYNRAIYAASQALAPVAVEGEGVAMPEKKIKLR